MQTCTYRWLMVLMLAWPALARGQDAPEAPADAGPQPVTVLTADSPWRVLRFHGSDLMRNEDGSLTHLDEWALSGLGKRSSRPVEDATPTLSPARVPDGWTAVEFDDATWPRLGASSNLQAYYPTPLILLRSGFAVDDTTAELTLEMKFEGGAVVYLNGMEVTRSHLPAGKIDPLAPAEDYPDNSYLAPDGNLLRNRRDAKAFADRFALRTRSLEDIRLPARLLRKGRNVLAVELHRSPAPKLMFTGKAENVHAWSNCWWSRLGVAELSLTARPGTKVVSAENPPASLRVWNHDVAERVGVNDRADPTEPLQPIRIVAARNGTFSGQVVVGGSEIAGLTARMSDMTGPSASRIDSGTVQVRFGLPDGQQVERPVPATFDSLVSNPPQKVEAGNVVPIWVTIPVPANAAAGDYRGTLTVSADGLAATHVDVEMAVIGWTLPDPSDFRTHAGFVQSPGSVALQYEVEMWSDAHWRLLDRTFELLAQAGCKTLYLPLVRRTHFGNEHSMVRWIRKGDGWSHDFSIVEKYVATAARRLKKIPVVVLYCFEPGGNQGHWGHHAPADREVLISVLDPATGKLTEETGPAYGSPQSQEFWRPVFDGVKKILARHGLADSMMVGMAGDQIPTKEAVADLAAVAPDAPWVVASHVYRDKVHDQPVGYLMTVWGVMPVWAPGENSIYGRKGRFYGWRNPFRLATFPRGGSGVYGGGMFLNSPQMIYRQAAVGPLMAAGRATARPEPGIRGFGRLGADFWPVLENRRGHNRGTLSGYYPEAQWGQLKVNFGTAYVLGPAPDGPAATVRLEMIRESMQEAECRILIGDAMLDHADQLGEAMTARCGTLLDGQVHDYLRGVAHGDWPWFVGSGWQSRSRTMYETAREVAELIRQAK